MPDLVAASTPQKFSFGGRDLFGYMVGFTDQSRRRYVLHEFLNRRGGRVEDKEQAPARLQVVLEFLGDTCAKDFQAFKSAVSDSPFGLLVHPVAGRYNAFCEGPGADVQYGRATNEIKVSCSFVESELDKKTPRDVPDVGTQAQVASAWKQQMEKGVAAYMGAVALADSFAGQVQGVIDDAINSIDTFAAPLDDMRSMIASTVGIGSQIVGKIISIQTKGEVLSQSIDDYIASATDLYNGSDVEAGAADASTTLLGAVQAAAADLEATLISTSSSPAGAADAVGDVEEATAACLLLSDAVTAAKPPVINYTVPETINLVVLAQRRYGQDAAARASDILGLNRIPNPAAIPAGTVLRIPSK